ncbi:RNA-directed DNA polymerase-like protein [Cucumis melo var. makuwa]|uniref:RNA-directed DNA polymerase-like protein n=1 Tax=Cucumis melo var. makuwa TaxID=1194695 RepID=A0A5A7UBJ1_CUCMM|nr:RNA-directed DNA polymerase-like protein [Cucumis melo var. makuwa]
MVPPKFVKLRKPSKMLLNARFSRPVQAPYGVHVLSLKKKDRSLQQRMDRRIQSKLTVRCKYPLPMLTRRVDRPRGAKYLPKSNIRPRVQAEAEIPMARHGHFSSLASLPLPLPRPLPEKHDMERLGGSKGLGGLTGKAGIGSACGRRGDAARLEGRCRLRKKGTGLTLGAERTCADVVGGSERARRADWGGAMRLASRLQSDADRIGVKRRRVDRLARDEWRHDLRVGCGATRIESGRSESTGERCETDRLIRDEWRHGSADLFELSQINALSHVRECHQCGLLREEDTQWSENLECQAAFNGLKQAMIEGSSLGVVDTTKTSKVKVEQFSCVLGEYQHHCVDGRQKNWVQLLKVAQFGHGAQTDSLIKRSSFEIKGKRHSVSPPLFDGPNVRDNPQDHRVEEERGQIADIARVCLEEASRPMEEGEDREVKEVLAYRVRTGRRPTREIHKFLVQRKKRLVEVTSGEHGEDLEAWTQKTKELQLRQLTRTSTV